MEDLVELMKIYLEKARNNIIMKTKLKIGLNLLVIGIIIVCGWWILSSQPKSPSPIQNIGEQDKITGLENITPEGWVPKKRGNNVVIFTRIQTCEREVYQKPNPEPIGKEKIHPTVTVIFEPLWDQEKIRENEECIEEWSKSPIAVAPPCKPVFVNTKEYTILVSGDSCHGETKEIIDILKAYFEK